MWPREQPIARILSAVQPNFLGWIQCLWEILSTSPCSGGKYKYQWNVCWLRESGEQWWKKLGDKFMGFFLCLNNSSAVHSYTLYGNFKCGFCSFKKKTTVVWKKRRLESGCVVVECKILHPNPQHTGRKVFSRFSPSVSSSWEVKKRHFSHNIRWLKGNRNGKMRQQQ